jgi:hypothetical protein
MKACGGVKVQRHSFIISELDGWRVVSFKPSVPLPPGNFPSTRSRIGSWLGPRFYLKGLWDEINVTSLRTKGLISGDDDNKDLICLCIGTKGFTAMCFGTVA